MVIKALYELKTGVVPTCKRCLFAFEQACQLSRIGRDTTAIAPHLKHPTPVSRIAPFWEKKFLLQIFAVLFTENNKNNNNVITIFGFYSQTEAYPATLFLKIVSQFAHQSQLCYILFAPKIISANFSCPKQNLKHFPIRGWQACLWAQFQFLAQPILARSNGYSEKKYNLCMLTLQGVLLLRSCRL